MVAGLLAGGVIAVQAWMCSKAVIYTHMLAKQGNWVGCRRLLALTRPYDTRHTVMQLTTADALGDHVATVRHARTLLRTWPGHFLAYRALADTYHQLGAHDLAAYWTRAGLAANPGDPVLERASRLLEEEERLWLR